MQHEISLSATARVSLADLRLFEQLASAQSLAEVAKAHVTSKASITRQLQRLEGALGHRLIHRGGSRLALTEEGRELLVKISGPLHALDVAVLEMSGHRNELVGRLRITAPYNFGRTVIAPSIATFVLAHPKLTVHLELTSRKVDLLSDESDLAVRIGAPGSTQLVARRLGADTVVLCASAAYLKRAPPLRSISDIALHTILDFRAPDASSFIELEDQHGKKFRIAPERIAVRSNEPDILAQAAIGGAGIAVLPGAFAQRAVDSGLLQVVLPGCGLPSMDINAIYAPGRRNSDKIRAFLDHLVNWIETAGPVN